MCGWMLDSTTGRTYKYVDGCWNVCWEGFINVSMDVEMLHGKALQMCRLMLEC